ncbi:MAG: hypothetical protein H6557_13045 [Lewinellaceae bacterium]|nr:hypothetical protein [Phaeodactylibacter sp.]MCB9037535.1 hypothetical protein [Lewinellaceae bacterium]
MAISREQNQPVESPENSPSVSVAVSREVFEREIMCDIMALRDPRYQKMLHKELELNEEEIKFLECGNPVGEILQIPTVDLAELGSSSSGVGCRGTQAFSYGVTCKAIRRIFKRRRQS